MSETIRRLPTGYQSMKGGLYNIWRSRRCQLDLEMANKLFTLIENGAITMNDPRGYYPQFKAEVLKILEK